MYKELIDKKEYCIIKKSYSKKGKFDDIEIITIPQSYDKTLEFFNIFCETSEKYSYDVESVKRINQDSLQIIGDELAIIKIVEV